MGRHSVAPGRVWIGARVGCRGASYVGAHWVGLSVAGIIKLVTGQHPRRDEGWDR